MEHLITHKSPNDFLKYNHDFIYDNYFIHYHIIIAFEKYPLHQPHHFLFNKAS